MDRDLGGSRRTRSGECRAAPAQRRLPVYRFAPRVTYTPGALAVSAAVVDRLTADALTRAD